MTQRNLSRRDLEKMVLAAAGGLLAGTFAGCESKEPAPKPVAQPAGDATADAGATPRLLEDPHVCRGINTCTNKGKSGTENKCAGQAHCATVVSHDCNGLNDCKGQGGCGEHPGENSCKGKGACEIPLSDKTWPIARKRFEELMTSAGKTFGDAPAKEG
jgi:hypothetical protein